MGLAVHVHSRSGAPIKIRGQWNSGLHKRLLQWITLHSENRLSDAAAYQLKMLADDYANWTLGFEETKSAMKADVARLLKRKRPV